MTASGRISSLARHPQADPLRAVPQEVYRVRGYPPASTQTHQGGPGDPQFDAHLLGADSLCSALIGPDLRRRLRAPAQGPRQARLPPGL